MVAGVACYCCWIPYGHVIGTSAAISTGKRRGREWEEISGSGGGDGNMKQAGFCLVGLT